MTRFLDFSPLQDREIKFVSPITHKPLNSAWWYFAWTCTLTTSRILFSFQVIHSQRSRSRLQDFFVFFSVHDLAAPCGQYLALSKAWRSCLFVEWSDNEANCCRCVQKVTGADLKYSVIVGKPSEITFRFAEHELATLARTMCLPSPKTLYMIGSVCSRSVYLSLMYWS